MLPIIITSVLAATSCLFFYHFGILIGYKRTEQMYLAILFKAYGHDRELYLKGISVAIARFSKEDQDRILDEINMNYAILDSIKDNGRVN